ncbi:BLUF domain-containing protein [Parasphingorhabdus sp. DH2-15]|uniref:BLUF domain-containing protein n=1 Tax=Parasphingorhabdus sp. DH2-15 TaxID=3444112 RepID=UPI003F685533
MKSVTYISTAKEVFDNAALDDLLSQCRAYNAKNDITGCLVYNGINFLQLIEGPESSIDFCMARIIADDRHSGVVGIRSETIGVREFPSWTMAGRLYPDSKGQSSVGIIDEVLQGARSQTRAIFSSFTTLKAA